MNQYTTYRVKGKDIGLEFLFKYDLNGSLKDFHIVDGILDEKQINWLFMGYLPNDIDTLPFTTKKELNHHLLVRFPATEAMFKSMWFNKKEMKNKFEIEKSPADLSFDAFWKLYDYKVDKFQAEKYFKKLKEAEIIKLFLSIPEYKKFLQRKNIAQKYPSTYITQRNFLDDYSKL